jgi:hypothetical protein
LSRVVAVHGGGRDDAENDAGHDHNGGVDAHVLLQIEYLHQPNEWDATPLFR